MNYAVLLLDDDSRFRRMVVPGLNARGISVTEVGTGKDAQELFSSGSFDLLIIDGVLPDIDGIALIARYRAAGGRVPIIFISARWQTPEVYRLLTKELEVLQIIHKPVIPKVFSEQVLTAITNPELQTSPANDISFDTSLVELSKEYFSELPEEFKRINEALDAARKNENRDQALKTLRLKCHRLRGTAGSFGLAELGELMGAMEDRIRGLDSVEPDEIEPSFFDSIAESMSYAGELLESSQIAKFETKDSSEQGRAASALLVIDHDDEFLDTVEHVAKQRLIRVMKARSAAEALSRLKKRSADAILLDLDSAGEHPLELVKSIRDLTNEETPIAVISDDTSIEERLLATHLGASLFLTKPLDPDTLEDALQRLSALSARERPRILILDDDAFFARRVIRVLEEQGMEVHALIDPSLILEKLEEVNPDILILDLMMPRISGFDICKMLRTIPSWQELPIIFVTAQTGLETRVAAFASGADDYIPKPLADEELIARVSLRVERARMIKERSERDPVSGLLIRRSFMERLNSVIAASRRSVQAISLVLFDLDNFKQINDQHGHLAGDATLAGLGRLMLKRFRVEDLRGRWGGDEFVLALVGSDKVQSTRMMQNFLAEFSQIDFSGDGSEKFRATLSAGISCFPEDSDNTYDLFRVADARLYEAKARGRNRVISESELSNFAPDLKRG